MKDFLARLSSRKFLFAVAAAVTLYQQKQYSQAAGVVVAFIAAEGALDLHSISKNVDRAQSTVNTAVDEAQAEAERTYPLIEGMP